MSPSKRLSSDERRLAILDAAVPLFAAKGFHGVKTKELAAAAEVSEALLYRHFPSKEAMYKEIPRHLENDRRTNPVLAGFAALEPSTEKLILGIHLLVSHLVLDVKPKQMVLPRLMVWSLLEGGGFARANMKQLTAEWLTLFDDAITASRATGDMEKTGLDARLCLLFAHHTAFTARVMALPKRPAADYKTKRQELANQMVRFALRGIGVNESAIRALYRPAKLEAMLR